MEDWEYLDIGRQMLDRAWDKVAAAKVQFHNAKNQDLANQTDQIMSDIAQLIWEIKAQIEPGTRAVE